MKNEISCDVCRDLIPLVRDGVASVDSCEAVKRHLEECEACREAFGKVCSGVPAPEKGLRNAISRLRLFLAMLLMFGILFGVSLTAGSGVFYNVVLMPLIGAVGYYLFRWKVLYLLPLLLTVTHGTANVLGLGTERLDLYSLLLWSGLYSLFALLGSIIAALLHFVFRREE